MIWIHSVLVTLVVVYAGGLVGNSSSFQDDSVWRIGFQFSIRLYFFIPFFFWGKSFFEFRYLTSFVRACGGLNAALSYRGPDFYLQRIAIIFQLCDTHVCLKLCWRIDVVSLSIVWKYHAEDDKVEKFVELRRRQGSCKVSRFVWLIALSITWIQEILACPKPPVIKSCLDRFYQRQDEFLAY